MKLARWNVNSIRARLPRLLAWLERAAPDVVCLQELKVPDDDFPVADLQAVGSEKWAYKLEWMARFRDHLAARYSPAEPLALCGDFNVAPDDRDVARPEEWRDSVLCHEDARRQLRDIASWGLVDTLRLHHAGPGPYTWWDYRMLAFPKGNGLRIDHIFCTRPLADRCTGAWVDREERKGKLPSDHAPVLIELASD